MNFMFRLIFFQKQNVFSLIRNNPNILYNQHESYNTFSRLHLFFMPEGNFCCTTDTLYLSLMSLLLFFLKFIFKTFNRTVHFCCKPLLKKNNDH